MTHHITVVDENSHTYGTAITSAMPLRYPPHWYSSPRRSSRRAKGNTFVLLFLSWFFTVITCVEVLRASSSNPLGQNSNPRKRRLYDMTVEQAEHALIKRDPRIVTGRHSRLESDTLLKSLIVKVEGPERINSAEELRLTTIITNTGGQPLMLVNEPSGVLYSRRPTDRFYVTHSTGMIPQFKGVRVKFSLRKAIELGDVTSLDPGQSISVIHHDLSKAYDFTAGFGHYNFMPRNQFFVVNQATKRVTMVQAGSTHGASVEWSRQLVARGGGPVVHVTFGRGCSEEERVHLEFATQKVVDLVKNALAYLRREQWNKAPEHCVPWFGKFPDDTRRNILTNTLRWILRWFEKNAQYDCRACPPHAHVVMIEGSQWPGLTMCPAFFELEGDHEKISALIYGLSYYSRYPDLGWYATGIEGCKELAKSDPDEAVKNIHSFGFFLLDVPVEVDDSDTDEPASP